MRTYNYLSNELPRELIEIYNDLQSDVLRIIVKELKAETPPDKVFAKIRNKVSSYDKKTEQVLAVIFANSKKKAVHDGEKDFEEEDKEPVTNKEANSIIERGLKNVERFALDKITKQYLDVYKIILKNNE